MQYQKELGDCLECRHASGIRHHFYNLVDKKKRLLKGVSPTRLYKENREKMQSKPFKKGRTTRFFVGGSGD